MQQDRLDNDTQSALDDIWQLSFPTKVEVFGWRFLFGKLPTRNALKDPHGSCFPLCFEQDGSISLFLCADLRG